LTEFSDALIDEVRRRIFTRITENPESVARQRRNLLKLMRAVDDQRALNRPDSVIRATLLNACLDDMCRRGVIKGNPRYEIEFNRASLAIDACLDLVTRNDQADDSGNSN